MCRERNIALLVLACIGFGKDAGAAEWALKSSLEQEMQYNDNMAFSNVQRDSVTGYRLKPSLQATRKTEVLDLGFEGQGDIRRYDDSSWDCDNYKLGLSNDYRTERSTFSLGGGYGRSCSYIQQIEDTGLITPNSQSKSYQVTPSWTWQWTARDKVFLKPSYSKTSYNNPLNGTASNSGLNFSGNETYSVDLGGSHEWSKLLSLNEKLIFSNIQYTGSSSQNQNLFGFQLGANYKINHNWTTSVYGGPMWVDSQSSSNGTTNGRNSSLSLGSIAGISLNYDFQLTKFSTGFNNSISPSAIGQTLETSSIFANYSYRLTEHLSLDLTSNYSRSESIGNTSTNQFNRDYFTISSSIAWKFAKDWQLKGSYTFSWQDYQQDNIFQNLNNRNLNSGTVDSNAVMFSLGYSWDGVRLSR
jgi:hypothetical protein